MSIKQIAMSLDSYVTLGNSGLRVSPFCLGTMTFGLDAGWGSSPEESETILSHYLEQGGNFIDTANIYTNGHSEKIIGDYFKKGGARRERAVIATKFFCNLFPGDPNAGGAGRKAIVAQCEESLRRLQMDHIDLYWLHNWDRFTPIEETLRALDDLVTAGKIRYIGFSDAPAWKVSQAQMIAYFRGLSPVIALQIEYSLLERTVEGELIPMAEELGMGVTPWSPLKGGHLSGKYTRENADTLKSDRGAFMGKLTEKEYSLLDRMREIADELGSTVARVALSWVQNRLGVASTIIGARRMEQLDDNLAALKLVLTPEHTQSLDDLTKPTLNFPADLNRERSPSFSLAGATLNGTPTTDPMAARRGNNY